MGMYRTDRHLMTRSIAVAVLAFAMLMGRPAPADADLTAFLSFSPTPASRAGRGFAFGINLLVVGFELEYAHTSEQPTTSAPGRHTGMINGLIQTPTLRTVLYLTAGGGFYRERLGTETETHVGTNIGGGIKVGLVGPLRLRVDYRIFSLRGHPLHSKPQRFYVGLNLTL